MFECYASPAAECVVGGPSPALLLIATEREGTDGDDARLRAADDDDAADNDAEDEGGCG